MKLSEKVEATLRQWVKPDIFVSEENLQPVGAAILAIPEIAEALSIVSAMTEQDKRRRKAWAAQTFPDKEG